TATFRRITWSTEAEAEAAHLKASDESYSLPSDSGGTLQEQAERDLAVSSETVLDQSSAQTAEALPQVEEPVTAEKGTHGQILKSSALVGGSSVVNIAVGIVRTKAMAILLGPAGYGLFGLYGSIANLAQTLAGMGVNSSGVRQIAAAVGSADSAQIALTTI